MPNLAKRITLIGGDVVHHAACRVHLGTAELLLGEIDAQRPPHQRRPANQNLGGAPGHDRKVGGHQAARREPRYGPQGRGGNGHLAHGVGNDAKAGFGEHRLASGAALAARTLDAAATAFQQAHERHPVLAGEMFGVNALAQPGSVRRAALQREVLATHHHPAVVDLAEADHIVGGHIAGQPVLVVVVGQCGGLAVLLERATVKQLVDTLTDGQPALGVLAGDAFLAPLLTRQVAPLGEFLDLAFPTHRDCSATGP